MGWSAVDGRRRIRDVDDGEIACEGQSGDERRSNHYIRGPEFWVTVTYEADAPRIQPNDRGRGDTQGMPRPIKYRTADALTGDQRVWGIEGGGERRERGERRVDGDERHFGGDERRADGGEQRADDVQEYCDGGEPDEAKRHTAEVRCDGGETRGNEVTSTDDTDDRSRDREKITQLHAVASEMVACRTVDQVYQRTVDAAERILEFDSCYVMRREGSHFVPGARSSSPTNTGLERVPIDHGLTGHTFETGEATLVRDIETNEYADPVHGAYRSGISVPIGEHGVLQGVSESVDAFDDTDLELAELLTTHASAAIDRIETEARLREREAALIEERDRLGALFENVPDPAVAYDLRSGDPIAREVNSAFERKFGYDAETVVGENIDEFIVPDGQEAEAASLNEDLRRGESLHLETRRQTADGVIDVLLHVVPVTVGEVSPRGFSIYTDITERKQRERELELQNERLEEFASIVSHDLRNPLNVARGYLELARGDGGDEHFEKIEAAHDRMDELIDGLLALAREGKLVGETESVDVETVAGMAWGCVRTGEASLEVEPGRIEADRDRLATLFENLFANAVTHGGSDVTVRIGYLDDGFYVEDDGVGIPAALHERVLRTGYTSTDGGTGLGLAIVSEIANAHGWEVTVTDSTSGGARFEFNDE